jgi:hypothetical protein
MTTVQQRSQQLVGSQSALGNAFRQTGTSVQSALGGLRVYSPDIKMVEDRGNPLYY